MATYLITGASRGIGLELTKQLLELPASQVKTVFAVTRSSPSGPLQSLIHESPDRAVSVLASVDDTASVQKAAHEIETQSKTGGLDVLINNAGIASFSPGGFKMMPPELLADVFNVNVIGAQRMIAAFLPLLEKGEQKKVVNMYVLMSYQLVLRELDLAPVLTYGQ
jgi:NAD(P)-dependent dehydrogenase (short-subunit alcohol dehydrogenase family)